MKRWAFVKIVFTIKCETNIKLKTVVAKESGFLSLVQDVGKIGRFLSEKTNQSQVFLRWSTPFQMNFFNNEYIVFKLV